MLEGYNISSLKDKQVMDLWSEEAHKLVIKKYLWANNYNPMINTIFRKALLFNLSETFVPIKHWATKLTIKNFTLQKHFM